MIHGSIATVVVFLLWIYMSVVILMYGVEFTAAYARLRRRPDREMPAAPRRGHEPAGPRSRSPMRAVPCCPRRLRTAEPRSLVSVEQEIEIGRSANAQVRKQMPELGTRRSRLRPRCRKRLFAQHPGEVSLQFAVADLPRDQRVRAAGRAGLDSSRRAEQGDQRVAGGRRAGA